MGFPKTEACLSCVAAGPIPSHKTKGDSSAFVLSGRIPAGGALDHAVFECRACGSFNLMPLRLIFTSRFDQVVKPGEPQHAAMLEVRRRAGVRPDRREPPAAGQRGSEDGVRREPIRTENRGVGIDWNRIVGGPNTPDNLARKGTALGMYVMPAAVGWARSFVSEAEKQVAVAPHVALTVLIETLILFVHVADRVAFDRLGPSLRNGFIDALEASVRDEFGRTVNDESHREALQTAFASVLPEREREYTAYRIKSDPGAGMKGDLFWEFSRRVVRLLDPEDLAPSLAIAAYGSVVTEILAVNIEKLLAPARVASSGLV